jgi:hypothetical protein
MEKRFSERLGFVKPSQIIQTDGMSDELKNSVWNFILSLFQTNWEPFAKWVAQEYLIAR